MMYDCTEKKVIIKLFPARESLVSDIPAGDGKNNNLFLQCGLQRFYLPKSPETVFVTFDWKAQ
jgi:hypothetical protein